MAYAIKDLHSHGKLRWITEDLHGFWGKISWYRKYECVEKFDEIIHEKYLDPVKAPKTWYYKRFKIKYKEKWFTSATATVFLTDGWHLAQFVFVNSLLAGFAILTHRPLLWFVVFRTIWFIVFNLSYSKLFSK